MRFAKLKLCCCMSLGSLVLYFSLGADRNEKKIPPPQPANGVFLIEGAQSLRLNAVMLDAGHWSIAGVVALTKDADGRTVVEVKKDGDFERDMVLTLPVRVIELDDGDTAIGGIDRVLQTSDTLTLYVEDSTLASIPPISDCYYDWGQHRCRKFSCSYTCSGNTAGGCDCVAPAGPQP